MCNINITEIYILWIKIGKYIFHNINNKNFQGVNLRKISGLNWRKKTNFTEGHTKT